MDPYLAKLIAQQEATTVKAERELVKKYTRGAKTFFVIKGPLTQEQHDLLIANMSALRVCQEILLRGRRPNTQSVTAVPRERG